MHKQKCWILYKEYYIKLFVGLDFDAVLNSIYSCRFVPYSFRHLYRRFRKQNKDKQTFYLAALARKFLPFNGLLLLGPLTQLLAW